MICDNNNLNSNNIILVTFNTLNIIIINEMLYTITFINSTSKGEHRSKPFPSFPALAVRPNLRAHYFVLISTCSWMGAFSNMILLLLSGD